MGAASTVVRVVKVELMSETPIVAATSVRPECFMASVCVRVCACMGERCLVTRGAVEMKGGRGVRMVCGSENRMSDGTKVTRGEHKKDRISGIIWQRRPRD